ncbi:hypothetical protein [Vulcanisaeta souniana]|uniref:hypothetical protein n=1 Tax=Vulcanisaeta souniana TaxID=164452 RepID=UPI000A4A41CE|nr:hypothetical protein [Vulcanisaeta souniana]
MSSLRSYLLGVTREYEMVLSMYRALVNIGSACDSGEYVGVIGGAALVESILKRSRNLTRFFGIARDRRYKDVVYYLMYLRRGGAREFRRRVRACSGYEYTRGSLGRLTSMLFIWLGMVLGLVEGGP